MQIGIFINYCMCHFFTILSVLNLKRKNKAIVTDHSIDCNSQITELIIYTKLNLHMVEMKTRQTTVGSPVTLINDQHKSIKSEFKFLHKQEFLL